MALLATTSLLYLIGNCDNIIHAETNVPAITVQSNPDSTYTAKQAIHTNPGSTHIKLPRGSHHDAQYPGIILKSGQTLKVRQPNLDFKESLKFQIYGNDAYKEKSITIPPYGTTISITVDSGGVPFIKNSPYR